MPYIKQETRKELDKAIEELSFQIFSVSKDHTELPGNLNYCITRLVLACFIQKYGKLRYWMVAMIDGVLSNVSREFYRRVAAPYEDQKAREKDSGDLSEFVYHDDNVSNDRKKELLYYEAVEAQVHGDLQTALEKLSRLKLIDANFRDSAERTVKIEKIIESLGARP